MGVCRGPSLVQQQVQVLSCLVGGILNGLLHVFLQTPMMAHGLQAYGQLL